MNTVGLSGASNPLANFGLQTTQLTSFGAPWSLGGPAPSMLGAVWPYGPSTTAFPSPSFPNPTLTSPSFLQASSLASPGLTFLPQGVPNVPLLLHALPVNGYNATAVPAQMLEACDPQMNKDDSIDVISIDSELNAHDGQASTPAKVYRCHKCGFTTKCVEEICQHWDTAHRAKHTWLACPKCAYRSRSMANMTNHGKAVHNEVAFEVGVRRMNPREESQETNKSIVGEATNVMKRRGANILRANCKRSKVVSEPISDAGDGSDDPESDELNRPPTTPAVTSGCDTPELPCALVIDERDDEWDVVEQRSQHGNQHNGELDKKNGELLELVKQLEEQLAEKEQGAKEKDALLETLSEENAQLNSDALRHKEAQQQLFAKQKELCSQISELLHAATERAGLTPQSPLSLPLQAAICYVDLLQQSQMQLNYTRQTQAPNPGPSLERTTLPA